VRLFGRCSPRAYILLPLDAARPARRKGKKRPAGPTPVVIPTDLLLSAFRQLFPAERMVIMGGRACRQSIKATSVIDVTEARPSISHVRADRLKLSTALVDLSRSGAHLAIWMHSHPGIGPSATFPSVIDVRQEEDLRRHYSNRLVCLIAVRDGFVRVWGEAIDGGSVVVRWQGQGITSHPGEPHVYQLELH